jgi:hypothetical protein
MYLCGYKYFKTQRSKFKKASAKKKNEKIEKIEKSKKIKLWLYSKLET